MTDIQVPQLVMLCGIPTSGKTTYLVKYLQETERCDDYAVLSTDSYIEREARRQGRAYNDAFDELIGEATKDMENNLRLALRDNLSIIWDQVNGTTKTRRRKLTKIPSRYERIAVWFHISLEEALRRNETRPGKVIPGSVLKRMFRTFMPPTEVEGFDVIIHG